MRHSVSHCSETEGLLDTQGHEMAEPGPAQEVWLQYLRPLMSCSTMCSTGLGTCVCWQRNRQVPYVGHSTICEEY